MGTAIARAINLIAAGLLAGNELGSLINVHPAFDELDLPVRVRAEAAITKRYGKVMPFLMSGALASFLPVLWFTRRQRPAPFFMSAGAMGCFAAMLATTLIGNVPINKALLDLDPGATTITAFESFRSRWTRLHVARNTLNILGLVLTIGAALCRSGSRN